MPLVNRTRITTSIKNDLYKDFIEIHESTKIDKSKLLDIAIELLKKEYEKKKVGF